MTEEIDLLAAEYVLGTLHRDERTLLMSTLANDPEARAAVAAWETRLAPLSAALDEVAPPPELWSRIESALPSTRPFAVVEGGLGEEGPAVPALRRSLARWRVATVATGALAAGLAIFIADRVLIQHPAVQPSYVAVVNRGGDLPALVVRVDLASGAVFVRPVAAEAPSGKSLELWYIGADKPPKSMGLIGSDEIRMPLPAGMNLDKASFAVTVEPNGGSPTGEPTGPIVYSGQLIKE